MVVIQNKSVHNAVRLFFALWPSQDASAELANAIEKLHVQCGGRKTRPETLHLTLVFLGAVASDHVSKLLELAGEVQTQAFDISLERFGWWSHNRIVWAAPKKAPPELLMLVDALQEKLRNAGFLFEEKSFVPHVTLLRKGNCDNYTFPDARIEWRAKDFVLVKSVQGEGGAAYEVLGRWPLL